MDDTSTERYGHYYGSQRFEGSAPIQLGDVNTYTFHYSTTEAKDAIYRNTLTVTLREMLETTALQGDITVIPGTANLARPAQITLNTRINTLETYLSRVQELEQAYLKTASARSDGGMNVRFVMADAKVEKYVRAAGKLIERLEERAWSQCSNYRNMNCLDDFCDLVGRLKMQIVARTHLDSILEHYSDEQTNQDPGAPLIPQNQISRSPTLGDLQQGRTASDFPISSGSESFHGRQEYLYATQDFWRRLASVLKGMVEIEDQCWYRLSKIFCYPGFALVGLSWLWAVLKGWLNDKSYLLLFAATSLLAMPFYGIFLGWILSRGLRLYLRFIMNMIRARRSKSLA